MTNQKSSGGTLLFGPDFRPVFEDTSRIRLALDCDRLRVFDVGLGPETIFLRMTLQSLRIVWNCRKEFFVCAGLNHGSSGSSRSNGSIVSRLEDLCSTRSDEVVRESGGYSDDGWGEASVVPLK